MNQQNQNDHSTAMKVFCLFFMTALALPAMAQTVETLDGWRRFKFGMSPDQAHALPLPGQPWKSLVLSALPKTSSLASRGPVKEFGIDFDVISLAFTADKGLQIIMLHSEKTASPEDCKKFYLTLLPAVEARYGSFAPMGSGQPRGLAISINDIPGAKSRYRLVKSSNGNQTMMAIRTFGARNISVRTSYVGTQGDEVCFTDVWFQQPEPNQPAPLPAKQP